MLHLNFNPFPTLKTDRLTLRQITLDDAEEIFVQRSHPTIQKYIKRAPALNTDDARDWIKKITRNIETGEGINWGIELKNETRIIGNLCLWNIENENGQAELGYALHPDYFGKGIMSEAVKKVLSYGFGDMLLKRIDAYTNKDNAASIQLLKSKGFERNFDFEREYEDKEELEYNTIYTLLNKKNGK